jgi:hypothetical protein
MLSCDGTCRSKSLDLTSHSELANLGFKQVTTLFSSVPSKLYTH